MKASAFLSTDTIFPRPTSTPTPVQFQDTGALDEYYRKYVAAGGKRLTAKFTLTSASGVKVANRGSKPEPYPRKDHKALARQLPNATKRDLQNHSFTTPSYIGPSLLSIDSVKPHYQEVAEVRHAPHITCISHVKVSHVA